MSSQQGQPSRPWFRLATMIRPPPPPPPVAAATPTVQPNQGPPPPRPTFVRPSFTTTAPLPQTTPVPPPQQPDPNLNPSPPRPTPAPVPPTKVVETPKPTTPPRRAPPSLEQSKQSRDPIPSPPASTPPNIIRLAEKTSPPLSPLVLPSAHKQKTYNNESPPEYKQKTMIVQENPKTSSTSKHMTSRKLETHKKQEDVGMKNTITIAGDNKGAIMKITPFSKTQEFGNNITRSSNGESSDTKYQNSNSSLLKTSFLNSNVQGVNNSMLFNCSIDHHDPGIHLTLSTKSNHGDSALHSKEG